MFSRLIAGPAVPANQRSVLPTVKGLPWWGAVLLAVGATTIGAMIDADSTSALGRAFKLSYLAGCLLAALTVRQRALFTAAAQPPLIAFIVGVTALYTLNASSADGIKSIVLKVVLPIATSFPWILTTFLLTLVVVLARWFLARPQGQALLGKAFGRTSPQADDAKAHTAKSGRKASGAKKLAPKKAPAKKQAASRTATAKTTAAKTTATRTATTRTGAEKQSTTRSSTTASTAHRSGAEPSPAPRSRRPAPEGVAQATANAERPSSAERAETRRTARPAQRTAARPSAQPTAAARQEPRRRTAQPSEPRPAPPQKRPAQAPAESRRRATPQTIPARDPGTPRRTAGQMRDKSHIEDLTAGADER